MHSLFALGRWIRDHERTIFMDKGTIACAKVPVVHPCMGSGVAVDGEGDIWVSNATCTSSSDTTCRLTLSEVLGIGAPTITPLASQAQQLQGTEPFGSGTPVPFLKKGAKQDGSMGKGLFGNQ